MFIGNQPMSEDRLYFNTIKVKKYSLWLYILVVRKPIAFQHSGFQFRRFRFKIVPFSGAQFRTIHII
jgi:hypothetical protein